MRSYCPECGFAAVPTAGLDLCPNCGTPLRADPPPPSPAVTPEALRARVEAWSEKHHGRLLVEIVKRAPGPSAYRDSAAVRESIRIRNRMNWVRIAVVTGGAVWGTALVWVLSNLPISLVSSIGTVLGVVVGTLLGEKLFRGALELHLHPDEIIVRRLRGGRALPAERVHGVRQERALGGVRVVLELDDGQTLCALRALSEHQADYVATLLRDIVGEHAVPDESG